ncbi:MAG: PH domain-containing protein [Micrococcales bacterium]|nr:PH domain-containing protein [Micrococcales bacterium]MCL2667189.1 PH domain-containing protein [Micrococcales bacterium]
MALSHSLLLDGEHIIISVRTHIKVLFARFGIALLVAIAGGATALLIGGRNETVGWWTAGITFVAVLVIVVPPLVRWFSWTYTLTNVRLIEQSGVVRRTGRVIPLSRVNDVSFEKDLNDRILGCGTLIVHDASEQAGLRLIDIPKIETFHKTISSLVLKAHGQGVGPGISAKDAETKPMAPDGDV